MSASRTRRSRSILHADLSSLTLPGQETAAVMRRLRKLDHWKARAFYIPGVETSWIDAATEERIRHGLLKQANATNLLIGFEALRAFSTDPVTLAENKKKEETFDASKLEKIEQKQEKRFQQHLKKAQAEFRENVEAFQTKMSRLQSQSRR